jgi:hypothetical protein
MRIARYPFSLVGASRTEADWQLRSRIPYKFNVFSSWTCFRPIAICSAIREKCFDGCFGSDDVSLILLRFPDGRFSPYLLSLVPFQRSEIPPLRTAPNSPLWHSLPQPVVSFRNSRFPGLGGGDHWFQIAQCIALLEYTGIR